MIERLEEVVLSLGCWTRKEMVGREGKEQMAVELQNEERRRVDQRAVLHFRGGRSDRTHLLETHQPAS